MNENRTPGQGTPRAVQRVGVVARWLLLGAALVGTAALSGYLSMRKAVRSGEVVVPALLGEPIDKATLKLQNVGLLLEKSGERMDASIPEGMIVSQDPPESSRLKRNRKVRVLVSLGKEVLRVPELVGQPARRAEIGLRQSGLKLGQIAYVTSSTSEADRILAQEPPPGSQRIREGAVDLLVSRGDRPKVWVMPDVEGRDLTSVTRLFSRAGLRVTNVRRETGTTGVPSGTVIQQAPPAGFPLREGDSISLTVSAEAENG